MTEQNTKMSCQICKTAKPSNDNTGGTGYCPKCNKMTINDINIFISETILIRENIKVKKFGENIKKFLSEHWSGWFESFSFKNGVDKTRIIDREKDEYHEVVKKYGTEEITHECHEKLSEHKGHGSVKNIKR